MSRPLQRRAARKYISQETHLHDGTGDEAAKGLFKLRRSLRLSE